MMEKTRKRNRTYTFSISTDLWEKIGQVCQDDISRSAFVRMAIKKELKRWGIG